mmetsp:Transcript_33/g.95  ORF Transcript_33/g.95 Transcript_33/m.95 type:complete len:220 (-) Transcript_33:1038-1697(-)
MRRRDGGLVAALLKHHLRGVILANHGSLGALAVPAPPSLVCRHRVLARGHVQKLKLPLPPGLDRGGGRGARHLDRDAIARRRHALDSALDVKRRLTEGGGEHGAGAGGDREGCGGDDDALHGGSREPVVPRGEPVEAEGPLAVGRGGLGHSLALNRHLALGSRGRLERHLAAHAVPRGLHRGDSDERGGNVVLVEACKRVVLLGGSDSVLCSLGDLKSV